MMSSEKDYVKISFIPKIFLIRKTDLKNIIGCSIVILSDKILIAKRGKTKKDTQDIGKQSEKIETPEKCIL